MKIKKLKINGFGKFEKKEIEFNSHINIVYGKNESGKSTLLKFILAMFYGLSRNKNGKFLSDYERYTPWRQEEFSGKIEYELDNKESYTVFREFKKKNPKIYNEKLEDISQQFNIDKTNGNQFFLEQTKVEEELFISTIVSEQGETTLAEKEQITLVQKMSNLAGTGEDTLSFQKIMNKLNKRQLQEIGTARSQDRPINIITKRLEIIEQQKEFLLPYQDKKYEIEETKQRQEKEIIEKEREVNLLKRIKQIQEENLIQEEKVKANQEIETSYREKIAQLKGEREAIEKKTLPKTNKKNKKNSMVILLGLIGIAILMLLLLPNKVIGISIGILALLYGIFVGYKNYKDTTNQKEERKSNKIEIAKLGNEIEVLENTNKVQEKERKRKETTIQLERKQQLEKVSQEYKIEEEQVDKLFFLANVSFKIESLQQSINEAKINLHRLEIDNQTVLPKLDSLSEIEEEQIALQEEYQNLIFQDKSIQLAKEEIQKAYTTMKETITPKFTNHLSQIMERISKGRYQKVKFDEENGIMVELENGDYILARNLSMGTIEQLYLSLRLSAGEEISEEKLPILLDESFAYYDTERLENVLTYLNTEYADRQILIFTCTNREKEVLEKQKIYYQEIRL